MIRVISLGAGVQSSTMALMFAVGELTPMPDCAIFADTGAEPKYVYDWLDWLETQLPFPVHRVIHKEGLLHEIMRAPVKSDGVKKERFVSVPFFTKRIVRVPVYEWNDATGDEEIVGHAPARQTMGMTRRQCTREFKIQPIVQKVRELVGLAPGKPGPRKQILVTQYIGISTDEATRMKDSQVKWIQHEWPLIDQRMSRADCLRWMESRGYPEPAKSSCSFCPYHDNDLWREMKTNDPAAWEQAVAVDRHIRSGASGSEVGPNEAELYLHRSLVPLDEADLRSRDERLGQAALFQDECEGMCGV